MNRLSKTPPATLRLESLEDRLALSVSTVYMSGGYLYIVGDNAPSDVRVSQRAANELFVRDATNGLLQPVYASSFKGVVFFGGNGDDKFYNYVSWLPTWAYGAGGNDYLEGYNATDHLFGGAGNDTLVGFGGEDFLYGEGDTDTLYGDGGNDQLDGGVGDGCADRLYGGIGADVFRVDQAPIYRWSSRGYWYVSGYYNQDNPLDFSWADYDGTYQL
jgi:Ca2+-binding RTX toxin-like protein